jgi:hypothetical protein
VEYLGENKEVISSVFSVLFFLRVAVSWIHGVFFILLEFVDRKLFAISLGMNFIEREFDLSVPL